MMIEKKNLPDMEDDINNYFTAYKSHYDKLDHNWQEELIGSPARLCQQYKRIGNHMFPQGKKLPIYYNAVSASDKAFGLFFSPITSQVLQ